MASPSQVFSDLWSYQQEHRCDEWHGHSACIKPDAVKGVRAACAGALLAADLFKGCENDRRRQQAAVGVFMCAGKQPQIGVGCWVAHGLLKGEDLAQLRPPCTHAYSMPAPASLLASCTTCRVLLLCIGHAELVL